MLYLPYTDTAPRFLLIPAPVISPSRGRIIKVLHKTGGAQKLEWRVPCLAFVLVEISFWGSFSSFFFSLPFLFVWSITSSSLHPGLDTARRRNGLPIDHRLKSTPQSKHSPRLAKPSSSPARPTKRQLQVQEGADRLLRVTTCAGHTV